MQKKKDTWGIVPMGAPFYTPDTSWGAGAYIVTYFLNDEDGVDKPDEISVYGTYTLRNQVSVGIMPEIFFKRGLFKLSAQLEASRFPSSFWGVGPDTGDNEEEEYTPREVWTDTSFLLRVISDVYIGPLVHFKYSRLEKVEEEGLLAAGSIRGDDGTDVAGVGICLQIDKRDSIFYTKRGFYISVKGSANRNEIGSEYDFFCSEMDVRLFFGIHGDHVLAIQAVSELSSGAVPFQAMGGLGGNIIMRGMLQNRYLDRCSIEAQTEYRFPLYWRFAGVVFGSMGEVQPVIDDFNAGDIHTAWGGGLRFIVDSEQHIAVRLDVGTSEEGAINAYLLVKEAF